MLLAQHILLQPPVSLQTNIQQNEKGNKQAEQQFTASSKARRCAFWRVAPPGIHHLRLAVNCQPHWPSYYTPISFHTDCEYKQKNCNLWRDPRLGDAPFGTSPRPAFTICGFQFELDTLQSIPPRGFTTYLGGSGRPTRGAHRLPRYLLALCSSHLGRCRPYLQKAGALQI